MVRGQNITTAVDSTNGTTATHTTSTSEPVAGVYLCVLTILYDTSMVTEIVRLSNSSTSVDLSSQHASAAYYPVTRFWIGVGKLSTIQCLQSDFLFFRY